MSADAINTNISTLESDAWHIPLPEYEFTLCNGTDSSRFLQGQLSCNLQKLSSTVSLRGALCNLKGRVIADMRLISDTKGILLVSQYAMREKIIATLNKYRVFFKTSLDPVQNGLAAIGLGGPALPEKAAESGISLPTLVDQLTEHPGFRIILLPQSALSVSPRFLCIVDQTHAAGVEIITSFTRSLQLLPANLWRLRDIRDGVVHIRPDQTELFTPQLVNYDINGVIDFKKGCYTGQEIVARMHYKAEAKRRLYHVRSIAGEADISDSAEIVEQLTFADGSVESLIILNVNDASDKPRVTDLT